MSRGLNFIVGMEVYPFDVMVSLGQTISQLKKTLISQGLTIAQKDRFTCMFPSGQILIRLEFIPKTDNEYSILQHEIFHAVFFLMNKVGIPLNDDTDEVYAYTIQFLTRKIYNFISS